MTDAFKTHPQPRTFAPSKEDVLQVRSAARPTRAPDPHACQPRTLIDCPFLLACAQNLQYFFVRRQPLKPPTTRARC